MEQKHKINIETGIKKYIDLIAKFSDTLDMEELIRMIHNPGWTTPAEAFLVKEPIDRMNEPAQLLRGIKEVFNEWQ